MPELSTKWNIVFWHGWSESIAEKLRPFCQEAKDGDGRSYFEFNGTLSEFFDRYREKMLVYPPREDEFGYQFGLIGVTQYNSFGQR